MVRARRAATSICRPKNSLRTRWRRALFALVVVVGEMDGAQGLGAGERVQPGGQRGLLGVEVGQLQDAVDERAQGALAQALGRRRKRA